MKISISWVACVPALLFLNVAASESESETPVAKVVALLKEMQEQAGKDLEADQEAYDKHGCWCQTNRGLKTEAVQTAEKRIGQLEAFLEEATGSEAQLKTEIVAFERSVGEDQQALQTAVALREKESEEFRVSEADTKESIAVLKDAVAVLSKVQLLQHRAGQAAVPEIRPLLVQVHKSLEEHAGHNHLFKDVMRRDLWDVMSGLNDMAGLSDDDSTSTSSEFLGKGRKMSALSRQALLSARDVPPNDLQGSAAGATSYSARSSSVFGMLSEMKDEFTKNLALLQKEDFNAVVSFQSLRAAKTGEIQAAMKAKENKEVVLADLQDKAAQAKEDVEATRGALGDDEKFLVDLEKNCKQSSSDFDERMNTRREELRAISETISILSQDDARDLFVKTMSLLQTASINSVSSHQKSLDKAMARIMSVAKKHKSWALASLAVHVSLDAFTRVKEAMDKMIGDLKAQHQEESKKKDYCNTNLDSTEDVILEKKHLLEDLESKKLGLENTIEGLKADVASLKAEVANTQMALKQAGETRESENMAYQQSAADQSGTMNVLAKAKERLRTFYAANATKVSLVQQEPGAAVAPPPPTGVEYKKSGGSGGVLQLLDKIIQDAQKQLSALQTNEQHAQKEYETMAQDSADAVSMYQTAITEKTKLLEESSSTKSEAEASLLSTGDQLDKLSSTLQAYHSDCDWLLKYFSARQQARSEEIEAIQEAKAILSGADFGSSQEPEE